MKALLVALLVCLALPTCAVAGVSAPPAVTPTPTSASGVLAAGSGSASTVSKTSAGLEAGLARPKAVAFEILAQEDALVGADQRPVTLALRGNTSAQSIPGGLPQGARTALRRALAQPDSDLYLVIYGGVQPSAGYRVRIEAITRQLVGSREQLVVDYCVEGPGPGQGAAAVLTYPYLVARVPGAEVAPQNVVFRPR
jgi:hypothetical protein